MTVSLAVVRPNWQAIDEELTKLKQQPGKDIVIPGCSTLNLSKPRMDVSVPQTKEVAGRYNVVLRGERGVITNLKTMRSGASQLERLDRRRRQPSISGLLLDVRAGWVKAQHWPWLASQGSFGPRLPSKAPNRLMCDSRVGMTMEGSGPWHVDAVSSPWPRARPSWPAWRSPPRRRGQLVRPRQPRWRPARRARRRTSTWPGRTAWARPRAPAPRSGTRWPAGCCPTSTSPPSTTRT